MQGFWKREEGAPTSTTSTTATMRPVLEPPPSASSPPASPPPGAGAPLPVHPVHGHVQPPAPSHRPRGHAPVRRSAVQELARFGDSGRILKVNGSTPLPQDEKGEWTRRRAAPFGGGWRHAPSSVNPESRVRAGARNPPPAMSATRLPCADATACGGNAGAAMIGRCSQCDRARGSNATTPLEFGLLGSALSKTISIFQSSSLKVAPITPNAS